MNEIIIQKDYGVVMFHDKSTRFIDEDEYNAIIVAYSTPSITKLKIGDSLYSKSSVSKILSLEEYWKEYPQAKPERKFDNQFKKYESIEQLANGRNGLASLIKGLKRFIDEQMVKGIKTPKAQNELDRMVKKYEIQYGKN